MCGIAGIVYRDKERPVDESLVRRMCTALKHRGPDDEGIYVNGAVGLGMRRLSIIDLGGGRQPIFNEDGSKLIVFNGEIYNYQELRRGLVGRGHTFGSSGDTEQTFFDVFGRVQWTKDADGFINYTAYDDPTVRVLVRNSPSAQPK